MDLYPVNFTYVKLQYEDYYVNDGEKKNLDPACFSTITWHKDYFS